MNEQEHIPSTAHEAKEKLERLVARGIANTAPVVERIMSQVPSDSLVRGDALDFTVNAAGVAMSAGEQEWHLHDNAVGQLCGRIGLPVAYARSLAGDEAKEWQLALLRHNLREHTHNSEQRYLVRAVRQQARAVLSDRFRRLDSRPLLDAFIGALTEVGAVPHEGLGTELSASVRAIIPKVHEPVPGEYMVFGLDWVNSDFGARAYSISFYCLRLRCLNSWVGGSQLKQVHLGGRLPEHIEFSDTTYDHDQKTMTEATKDVVRGALGAKSINAQLDLVRRAHETEVDWASAWRRVSRELTKAEQQSIKEAFDGPDVVNLPPGKTNWRLSNSVSWLAHSVEDQERRQELQRLAGALVEAA